MTVTDWHAMLARALHHFYPPVYEPHCEVNGG